MKASADSTESVGAGFAPQSCPKLRPGLCAPPPHLCVRQSIARQLPSTQAIAWAGALLGVVSRQHLGSKGNLGLVLGGESGWHTTASTLWCHTIQNQVLVVPLLS